MTDHVGDHDKNRRRRTYGRVPWYRYVVLIVVSGALAALAVHVTADLSPYLAIAAIAAVAIIVRAIYWAWSRR